MNFFLIIAGTILVCNTSCGSASNEEKQTDQSSALHYSCLPCGSTCDTAVYDKPGTCIHCKMELVDKSTIVHKNIQPEQMCLLDEKKSNFS